jgi:hypothetical protein
MEPNEHGEIARPRRQCRWAAVTAVLLIALGMAIALPPALRKRRALKAANEELLSVQAAIVDTQAQIRDVQAKILATQARVRAILDGKR